MALTCSRRLTQEPGIRVLNDVVINQVALAFGPEDDTAASARATRETLARVQSRGVCFPSIGEWHGATIMRISVSSQSIDKSEADRSADAIIAAWREVKGETG